MTMMMSRPTCCRTRFFSRLPACASLAALVASVASAGNESVTAGLLSAGAHRLGADTDRPWSAHLAPHGDGVAVEVRAGGARDTHVHLLAIDGHRWHDGVRRHPPVPSGCAHDFEPLRGSQLLASLHVAQSCRARLPVDPRVFGSLSAIAVVESLSAGGFEVSIVLLPGAGTLDPFAVPPADGALVVTEFMKDPAVVDARGEWFELHNTTGTPIDVEGYTLRDDGSNATVLAAAGAGIIVPPGGYVALGRNADPLVNGGAPLVASYAGFTLANGADQIVLEAPSGDEVCRLDYGDGPAWPDTPGRSISLDPRWIGTAAAALPSEWCEGTAPMAAGDLGSPGAPNRVCVR